MCMMIIFDMNRDDYCCQLCVSLPCKLSPYYTCVLNIGNLILYLTINFSVADSPYRRKRCKLDLKVSVVSHDRKARKEDESDIPIKDNKIEGKYKSMKIHIKKRIRVVHFKILLKILIMWR